MPLCGVKKSKKQKRDPSPPYGKESELKDQNERNKKEIEELRAQLEDANNAKNRFRDEAAEAEKWKKRATELEKQTEDAEKDKVDGDAIKREKEEENKKVAEQLKTIEVEKEEEKKKRETTENEKKRLEDELKQARKHLETERNQRVKIEEEKNKFKKEKDSLETDLSLTKKELDSAKKESHIPRSPTRPPTEEWKAKIENAEEEFKKERQQRIEKEKDISRLTSEKDLLAEEKEEIRKELETIKVTKEESLSDMKKNLENTENNYKTEIERLQEQLEGYKNSLKSEAEAKEELLTRLSAATATKVLDGNPNVSDLSDPNRPQKLGEYMSQLYDDQWTDASEALEKMDKNEEEVIRTLLDLLVEIYNHCTESAESQLARIEEDMFLPPMDNPPPSPEANGTEPVKSPTSKPHSMSKIPRLHSHKGRPALPNLTPEKKTVENETNIKEKEKPKRTSTFPRMKGEKLPEIPQDIRKGVKEYRKRVTKQVVPVLEKEVLNKLRSSPQFGEEIVDACKPYIIRCVELCWLMRVQDPPVTLSWKPPNDQSFDSDTFRAYMKTGSHVDYVVWPAMYLYEGGPTLMKGVAQGTNL